jgi:hypothetical protein
MLHDGTLNKEETRLLSGAIEEKDLGKIRKLIAEQVRH